MVLHFLKVEIHSTDGNMKSNNIQKRVTVIFDDAEDLNKRNIVENE